MAGVNVVGLRIWVIVSDEGQRRRICEHLVQAGMDAMGMAGTAELPLQCGRFPDVAVCNAELPDESGLSVAARLRMATGAGVILLTDRKRQADRILGLSLGVDHCLTVPVDLHEQELHIRNLAQRLGASALPAVWPIADMSVQTARAESSTGWRFDVSRWQLVAPEGQVIPLSLSEHLILQRLLEDQGNVVSRDAMLIALKGRSISIYSRNLDMIVSRLRRKVEKSCGEKLPVLSARGIGYVFTGICSVQKDPEKRVARTTYDASMNLRRA